MKCLFDNNMPPKLARTINYLEGDDGITVEHLKDKFPADISDIDWIKKLTNEGDWFVITRDKKKDSRKESLEGILYSNCFSSEIMDKP